MKAWQWLILALLGIVALIIPMTEDAPKGQEWGSVELVGTGMPEIGCDE